MVCESLWSAFLCSWHGSAFIVQHPPTHTHTCSYMHPPTSAITQCSLTCCLHTVLYWKDGNVLIQCQTSFYCKTIILSVLHWHCTVSCPFRLNSLHILRIITHTNCRVGGSSCPHFKVSLSKTLLSNLYNTTFIACLPVLEQGCLHCFTSIQNEDLKLEVVVFYTDSKPLWGFFFRSKLTWLDQPTVKIYWE